MLEAAGITLIDPLSARQDDEPTPSGDGRPGGLWAGRREVWRDGLGDEQGRITLSRADAPSGDEQLARDAGQPAAAAERLSRLQLSRLLASASVPLEHASSLLAASGGFEALVKAQKRG